MNYVIDIESNLVFLNSFEQVPEPEIKSISVQVPEPEIKPEQIPEIKPISVPEIKPISVPEQVPEIKPIPVPEQVPEIKPIPVPEIKPIQVPEIKPEQIPEIKPEQVPEIKPIPEQVPEQVPEIKPISVPEIKPDQIPEIKPIQVPEIKPIPVPEQVPEIKPIPEQVPEIKPIPEQVPEIKPEQVPEIKPIPVPEQVPEIKPIPEQVLEIKPRIEIINEQEINITKKRKEKKDDVNDSCSLDILAIYLKGQKIIYMESKTYCQQILNVLMLPAIFISALTSVLSYASDSLSYSSTIVASLNGLNTFILSLISYLKLDAKAEAHRMSSYKFDILQSQCEFKSGQILLFDMSNKKIILKELIETIEKEVIEIKSTNQYMIPEYIRDKYINIYSINIFSLVKTLLSERIIIKNKINAIKEKINKNLKYQIELKKNEQKLDKLIFQENQLLKNSIIDNEQILNDIKYEKNNCNNEINLFNNELNTTLNIYNLNLEKDKLLDEYYNNIQEYIKIDKIFKDEIEKNSKNNYHCFSWLKT